MNHEVLRSHTRTHLSLLWKLNNPAVQWIFNLYGILIECWCGAVVSAIESQSTSLRFNSQMAQELFSLPYFFLFFKISFLFFIFTHVLLLRNHWPKCSICLSVSFPFETHVELLIIREFVKYLETYLSPTKATLSCPELSPVVRRFA